MARECCDWLTTGLRDSPGALGKRSRHVMVSLPQSRHHERRPGTTLHSPRRQPPTSCRRLKPQTDDTFVPSWNCVHLPPRSHPRLSRFLLLLPHSIQVSSLNGPLRSMTSVKKTASKPTKLDGLFAAWLGSHHTKSHPFFLTANTSVARESRKTRELHTIPWIT